MKIAVITGGSRGLGRNMTLHLTRKNIGVVFTYRSNLKEAESLMADVEKFGGKAVALQLDVAESKSFSGFAESLQKVLKERFNQTKFDFLVNNAGIGLKADVAELTEDDFDELMKIHLKAPFFLTQKLLPFMNDGGRILNISTGLARFAVPGYAAYASMKGGIEVFTRYLAKELGPRKITVNVLAPGAIETDFGGGASRDNPQVNAFLASQTALGRVGLPDDIGSAVNALLSDDCAWITGQRIEASGGMFI